MSIDFRLVDYLEKLHQLCLDIQALLAEFHKNKA